MGDTSSSGLPTSWRDVYTLVQDSGERIEEKVDKLAERFDQHLLEHAGNAGERRGEARVLGFGRSTVALVVSLLSGMAAAAAVIRG